MPIRVAGMNIVSVDGEASASTVLRTSRASNQAVQKPTRGREDRKQAGRRTDDGQTVEKRASCSSYKLKLLKICQWP